MAHFAKIGLNNKVIQVVHVPDSEITDDNDVQQEQIGKDLLEQRHGWPLWVQCSINTSGNQHYTYNDDGTRVLSETQEKAFRGNFPAIGDIWDETNNYFYQPKPTEYPSFVWDSERLYFKAPIDWPTKSSYMSNSPNKFLDVDWSETDTTFKGLAVDGTDEVYLWDASTSTWNLQ